MHDIQDKELKGADDLAAVNKLMDEMNWVVELTPAEKTKLSTGIIPATLFQTLQECHAKAEKMVKDPLYIHTYIYIYICANNL